ncbi:MAG: glycosyltransferase family 4 protein, partial [Patescibacteria group bacterium]
PFAKIISRKIVIADLLGSFKDAQIHSHNSGAFRRLKDSIIDWMAVKFSDTVLLESEAQRDFFIKRYGNLKKFKVLYTGVEESVFCQNGISRKEGSSKIILFRGRLTPESGIFHILKSAELLKERKDIIFRIVGFHYQLGQQVKDIIKEKKLANVELVYDYLSDNALFEKMKDASISLGQFESSPRLDRTIPHKVFESMIMKIPLITAHSPAVGELLKDGEDCIFVRRADPAHLAEKISFLADNPEIRKKLADNARFVYDKKCSTEVLTAKLFDIINKQR